MPVTALGCHTTKLAGFPSPAAAKYVSQSRPGALVPKSARVQWLFPLVTSPDSSRLRCASHLGLEPHDRVGLGLRVRDVGEAEHGSDVGLVLVADRRHRRRRVDVVAPVGHAEPALQQERRVVGRVVQVLRDPEAEQISV